MPMTLAMSTLTTLAALFLQAAHPTTAGIGGVAPVLLPDVPIALVLAFGALNPALIGVAFLMGRQLGQTDGQRAKLGIASFAGAIAGIGLIWLGTHLSTTLLATPARASGGIFIASLVFGLAWAWLGYGVGLRARRR